jgi:hypothetical protein
MTRIVWPRGEPLMWAQGPDWDRGFFVEEPGAGDHLAGIPFSTWHAALTDAMHWAYEPENRPPSGWRLADEP